MFRMLNKNRVQVLLVVLVLIGLIVFEMIDSTSDIAFVLVFVFLIGSGFVENKTIQLMNASEKKLDERELSEKYKALSASNRINRIITMVVIIAFLVIGLGPLFIGLSGAAVTSITTGSRIVPLNINWVSLTDHQVLMGFLWMFVGLMHLPALVLKWNEKVLKD